MITKFMLVFMFISAVIASFAEVLVFLTYNRKQMDKALDSKKLLRCCVNAFMLILVLAGCIRAFDLFSSNLIVLVLQVFAINFELGICMFTVLNIFIVIPVCRLLRRKLCIEIGGNDE